MLNKFVLVTILVSIISLGVKLMVFNRSDTNMVKVACVGDSITHGDGAEDFHSKYLFWIKALTFCDPFSDSYPG